LPIQSRHELTDPPLYMQPNQTPQPALVSGKEAARFLDVSVSTLARMGAAGMIGTVSTRRPNMKQGKRLYVLADVVKFAGGAVK